MDDFTDDSSQNDLITCPYNVQHRIRRSLMAEHLEKCDSVVPEIVACPYNTCHRYPQADMDTHVRVCSSKPIPDDFVADFEKDLLPVTRKDEHGNEIPGASPLVRYSRREIDMARALMYPLRPGAGPLPPYRPRPSYSVPRSYMPPIPRMALVRGNLMPDIAQLPDEPFPPFEEWNMPELERPDEPN